MISACARIAASIALAVLTAACALDGERLNADGTTDHQAVIGYLVSWSVAEQRAAEVCPAGFTVISKLQGFSSREMFYRCKD